MIILLKGFFKEFDIGMSCLRPLHNTVYVNVCLTIMYPIHLFVDSIWIIGSSVPMARIY